MNIKKTLFYILLFSAVVFCTPLTVYAAENITVTETAEQEIPAIELFGEGVGYSSVLYNNTNGLPTAEANAIAQTSDGFIWMGGYGGLVRYDGSNFERIDTVKNITGVRSLYVDSSDRLWIGSSNIGIAVMKNDTFHYWGKNDGMSPGSVDAITEDENGLIYAATRHGLALIDTDMNLRMMDDERIKGKYINDMEKGSDGLIYALTVLGDVFTLKNGSIVNYLDHTVLGIETMNCLLPDPKRKGYVYLLGNTPDLLSIDMNRKFDTDGTDSDLPYDVTFLGDVLYSGNMKYINGLIWICSGSGANVINPDNEAFYRLANVPMNRSFGDVMKDYQGNLWFTSTRQGVMKVVPNQFTNLYEKYSLSDAVVNSTCLYDNKLFIGTDTGLTVLDQKGSISSLEFKLPDEKHTVDIIAQCKDVRIRSVIRDSKNRLWISTWGKGLYCCDNGYFWEFNAANGLFLSNVRTICERKNGSVIAVGAGGISLIDPVEKAVLKNYDTDDGILNTALLSAAEDDQGNILLGSDGDGIYIIDQNDNISNLSINDGLTSGIIMRIHKDAKRDIFWLITGDSIAYMDRQYKITTVSSFNYSNNFDLCQNSKDEMWILNSAGIAVVPTQKMLDNKTMNPIYYTLSNGLPFVTTANSYSELTPDGDLYISGGRGVAKVNIETAFHHTNDIKAGVPYITADNTKIYPDRLGNFTIPADVRKITIYCYVYNYSLVSPQISYRLDGFETDYDTVDHRSLTPIDYTNLSGGTYHFVVEVDDPSGIHLASLSVGIFKERAFYEHIWFYIILAVILFLIIGILVRAFIHIKIRRLEKRHREEVERERINTELQTASQIQTDMMPNTFPAFPDRNEFDIYASMSPAKEVGGDFYDFFLTDENHLCMVMADVSGKGIPAALFMMSSKIILKNFAMMGKSPAEILALTNDTVCATDTSDMFVTVWVGVLDIATGLLTAANAGHEYPVLKQPDGKFEIFKDKHGLVVGGMEGMKYKEYEIQLQKGSKLFLYTDGVPEATNASEELFGTERMLESLNHNPDDSLKQILSNVRRDIDDFVRNAEQFDDLTMLGFEYKNN